jgi:hypothetical protein
MINATMRRYEDMKGANLQLQGLFFLVANRSLSQTGDNECLSGFCCAGRHSTEHIVMLFQLRMVLFLYAVL